eukprot:GFUD01015298.1.p1 GENE.GFUD01015298.1~~GFUD01015298.1.p1  ORF type:complete len:531 (+),score=188.60 GFUD01015298.1:135-1727(+)
MAGKDSDSDCEEQLQKAIELSLVENKERVLTDSDFEKQLQEALELSLSEREGFLKSSFITEFGERVADAFAIYKLQQQNNLLEPKETKVKTGKSGPKKCHIEENVVELSGLPWTATEEDIRKFLKDCEISKILIILNVHRKPSGTAHVWVSSKEDLDKALLCDKELIGPRYINVSNANEALEIERKREQTKDRSTSADPKIFTLKLSGLPWSATCEQICDFLFGCEVVDGPGGVKIEMNERGQPSGSAFVQFKTNADAENALKYNKQKLGDRYVDMEKMTIEDGEAKESKEDGDTKENKEDIEAKENKKDREAKEQKGDGDAKEYKIDEEAKEKKEDGVAKENKEDGETKEYKEDGKAKENNFCIKLSGLARKATQADISDFLSVGHVKQVGEIVITVNGKGKPSGDAFVKVGSNEDLKVALCLNDTAFGNRRVEVHKVGLAQLEKARKNIFCIKLSCLSRKITENDISKFLSDGNVKQVAEISITINEKGTPTGDAFVKLGSEEELRVALGIPEKVIGNRRIEMCQVNM